MFGTNLDSYGHLINIDNFNSSLVRPEMYEIFLNPEVKQLNNKLFTNIYNLFEKGLGQSLCKTRVF